MTLWSIVPAEIVLNTVITSPTYEEIELGGMKCLVEKTSPTQCRVVRLLTTDPSEYLCNELQPGTILTYEPTIKKLS